MGLRSIPDGEQEKVYQLIRLALSQKNLIDGLTEHYRQTNGEEMLVDETVADFSDILRELSVDSLADLFYETAISVARYEPQARKFYIDPKCTRGYSIDGLYAHLYREALEECLGNVVSRVDRVAIQVHLSEVLTAIDCRRNKEELSLGNLRIEVSPAKGAVHLSRDGVELLLPANEKTALESSLRQWYQQVNGVDLEAGKNEGYAP